MTIDRRGATIDVYAQAVIDDARRGEGLWQAAELSRILLEVEQALSSSPELRNRLTDLSAVLNVSKEQQATLFEGLPPIIQAVLGLLFERGELGLLRRVNMRLTEKIESEFNVAIIDVTTVVPLNDRIRDILVEKYSVQLGCGIVLREHIDKSIMGGIIMQTRGRRIDASLIAQMASAREVLTAVPVGGVDNGGNHR